MHLIGSGYESSRVSVRSLRAALRELHGKRCWAVMAGEGTGANFTLHLGQRVLRRRPLNNSTASSLERRYQGEFVLYVKSAWRLERELHSICSSQDVDRHEEFVISSLKSLVNRAITRTTVRSRGLDLLLFLDDNTSISVFSDDPALGDELSFAYSLSCTARFTAYTVTGRGSVSEFKR